MKRAKSAMEQLSVTPKNDSYFSPNNPRVGEWENATEKERLAQIK